MFCLETVFRVWFRKARPWGENRGGGGLGTGVALAGLFFMVGWLVGPDGAVLFRGSRG